MATLNFDVFWRDHGASSGMKKLGDDADKSAKRMSAFAKVGVGAALSIGLWTRAGSWSKMTAGSDPIVALVLAWTQDSGQVLGLAPPAAAAAVLAERPAIAPTPSPN
jgi:hypothetical protein